MSRIPAEALLPGDTLVNHPLDCHHMIERVDRLPDKSVRITLMNGENYQLSPLAQVLVWPEQLLTKQKS